MATIEDSRPAGATSEAQIKAFEKHIGHGLPKGYREFLLEHNGGRPSPDAFTLKQKGARAQEDIVDLRLVVVVPGDRRPTADRHGRPLEINPRRLPGLSRGIGPTGLLEADIRSGEPGEGDAGRVAETSPVRADMDRHALLVRLRPALPIGCLAGQGDGP